VSPVKVRASKIRPVARWRSPDATFRVAALPKRTRQRACLDRVSTRDGAAEHLAPVLVGGFESFAFNTLCVSQWISLSDIGRQGLN